MRTLRQLSEEVNRLYSRGPAGRDSKIDIREIARLIRDVANAMIPMKHYEGRELEGDPNMGAYAIASYVLPVLLDTRTGRNYSELSEYIRLPHDKGVQRVKIWDESGIYRNMIPIPYDAEAIIDSLEAGSLSNRWSYALKGFKVFYGKRCGKTVLESGYDQVDVDMVIIPPADALMDSPFPLPPDMWSQAKDKVLEQLAQLTRIPDDQDNDNQSP